MISKHIARCLFVLFWASISYLFLHIPYIEKFLYKDQKYLCIYTWADRIDESILKNFEKETGITVYVNHYESNEELLTKLEKMPYVDCDIILPTGYIIPSMRDAGLIKQIDLTKCNFLDSIYSDFLHVDFDKNNEYSLPLYWDVLGIGYNHNKIQHDKFSLDMMFNHDHLLADSIGMIDDARQSIFLTALYLGYPLESLSKEQLKVMRTTLRQQKKWVGAYSDSQQGYYLASKTFLAVISERAYICRQMLKRNFISFAIPEEGSLLSIDNVVVSSATKKDDMVYQFINYLFSEQVLKQHCEMFCLLPVSKNVFESLDQKYIGAKDLYPGSNTFKKLRVFKNILTPKEINDFWVRLKSV